MGDRGMTLGQLQCSNDSGGISQLLFALWYFTSSIINGNNVRGVYSHDWFAEYGLFDAYFRGKHPELKAVCTVFPANEPNVINTFGLSTGRK